MKKQIQELREVAQIFQSELSKVQDSETAIKKHVQTRIEEVERHLRSKVQELEDAFSRLNKNLDKDFEQVDKEMQKLRSHLLNATLEKQSIQDQSTTLASPKGNQQVETLRQELREIKGLVDFMKDEISQKSNIKDVCVLVDMKANSEDLKRSIEEVQKSVQVQQR